MQVDPELMIENWRTALPIAVSSIVVRSSCRVVFAHCLLYTAHSFQIAPRHTKKCGGFNCLSQVPIGVGFGVAAWLYTVDPPAGDISSLTFSLYAIHTRTDWLFETIRWNAKMAKMPALLLLMIVFVVVSCMICWWCDGCGGGGVDVFFVLSVLQIRVYIHVLHCLPRLGAHLVGNQTVDVAAGRHGALHVGH
jgi:hypothetical protein